MVEGKPLPNGLQPQAIFISMAKLICLVDTMVCNGVITEEDSLWLKILIFSKDERIATLTGECEKELRALLHSEPKSTVVLQQSPDVPTCTRMLKLL